MGTLFLGVFAGELGADVSKMEDLNVSVTCKRMLMLQKDKKLFIHLLLGRFRHFGDTAEKTLLGVHLGATAFLQYKEFNPI